MKKCQGNTETCQEKFYMICQYPCKQHTVLVNLKIIKNKILLIISLPVLFIPFGPRIEEMKKNIFGATTCRRWSYIGADKLLGIIFGKSVLKKILSINVLELVFTLVVFSIWVRK